MAANTPILLPATSRTLRRARGRAFIAGAIRASAFGLLAGAAAAMGASALAKLALWNGRSLEAAFSDSIGPHWHWSVPAAFAITGVGLGVIHAWSRRWSTLHAARVLDERLMLKDTLTTAWEMAPVASGSPADPLGLVPLVAARAEAAAHEATLSRAIAVRVPMAAPVGLAILAGAIVINFLAPARTDSALIARATPQPPIEDAAKQIAELNRAVDQADSTADGATASQSQSIAELERELANRSIEPREAMTRAAEQATNAAAAIEQDAAKRQREAQEAMARVARATRDARAAQDGQQPPELTTDAARELASALEKGDLDKAAQALDEISRQTRPEEREQVAKDLERLSEAIGRQAQAADRALPADGAPPADSNADSNPDSNTNTNADSPTDSNADSNNPSGPSPNAANTTPSPPSDASQPDARPTDGAQASEAPIRRVTQVRPRRAIRQASPMLARSNRPRPTRSPVRPSANRPIPRRQAKEPRTSSRRRARSVRWPTR